MNKWKEAARPRTLPASIVPVLVGTVASHRFSSLRFVLVLIVALALQIGVNFANDYFDGTKGVDTPDRIGPRRMVASGLISPRAMRGAMLIAFLVAAGAGSAICLLVDKRLFLVGLAAIPAAVGYSGGPKPYGSVGLGEVFVFVFFGLVATAGSAYVQSLEVTKATWSAGVVIGLLAVAILIANNIRDIDTDSATGKRTLAVRVGRRPTTVLYNACIIVSFLGLFAIAYFENSLGPLLALAALPLAARAVIHMRHSVSAQQHLKTLALTARLELVFGVLLAVGILL